MNLQAPHPLVQRLITLTQAACLDDEPGFDAWAARPGLALLLIADEPERQKETLDLAVILPELLALRPQAGVRLGLAALLPARALAARYGVQRWPAFVMLRDGAYVGKVEGLRDWDEYQRDWLHLLQASPSRPPGVGIAVVRAGAPHASEGPACAA